MIYLWNVLVIANFWKCGRGDCIDFPSSLVISEKSHTMCYSDVLWAVHPHLILLDRSQNQDSDLLYLHHPPSCFWQGITISTEMNITSLPVLLCEMYAESRGKVQVIPSLPTFSNYESSRGFRRKFRFARRLSCARRWLNCLDMSWNGWKLWSDVRILVLIMSGKDIGSCKGSTGQRKGKKVDVPVESRDVNGDEICFLVSRSYGIFEWCTFEADVDNN